MGNIYIYIYLSILGSAGEGVMPPSPAPFPRNKGSWGISPAGGAVKDLGKLRSYCPLEWNWGVGRQVRRSSREREDTRSIHQVRTACFTSQRRHTGGYIFMSKLRSFFKPKTVWVNFRLAFLGGGLDLKALTQFFKYTCLEQFSVKSNPTDQTLGLTQLSLFITAPPFPPAVAQGVWGDQLVGASASLWSGIESRFAWRIYMGICWQKTGVRLIDLLGLMAELLMVDTCSFPWINSFFEHSPLVHPSVLSFPMCFCLVQGSQSLQP